MKIKTKDLIRHTLDWAVALCEKKPITLFCGVMLRNGPILSTTHADPLAKWSPSTYWSQGGPIIERYQLDIEWVTSNRCRASYDWLDEEFYEGFGPTPLIAAMRCYVASKLGDEVDVPNELMEN